jgi:Pentapeptide repeats (8 copies)
MPYIHLGQNYRGIDGRIIRPHESVRFCNLRDANFQGVDITGVEFLGCRFNGASFINTDLSNAKFIGCFASSDYDPMYLEENVANKASFINCHLPYVAMQGSTSKPLHWSSSAIVAATKLLSADNGARNTGVKQLQELADPTIAPFLASCLLDEEWDVVVLTIKALTHLRQTNFPHHDAEIVSWMMFCLGHEHQMVREEIAETILQIKPSDELLMPVLDQAKSHSQNQQLKGLRAAASICRADANYIRLVDLPSLEQSLQPLINSVEAKVHDDCLHWLDMLHVAQGK